MRYTVAALVITVIFTILNGCGQMGPLYLPGETAPESKPGQQTDNSKQQIEDA